MGKLTVWEYIKAEDFINRYQDQDDTVSKVTIVDNLPEAKARVIAYLTQLIKEVEDLKLKDIK